MMNGCVCIIDECVFVMVYRGGMIYGSGGTISSRVLMILRGVGVIHMSVLVILGCVFVIFCCGGMIFWWYKMILLGVLVIKYSIYNS